MSESFGSDVKRIYPASSLVQSLFNWAPYVNRAGHCLENSQWASGRVDDISIMQLTQKHLRVKKMGHLLEDTNKNVFLERQDSEAFVSTGQKPKSNRQTNPSNSKRLCCLWPNYKPATWPWRNPHHVLPPAHSTQAPHLTWAKWSRSSRCKRFWPWQSPAVCYVWKGNFGRFPDLILWTLSSICMTKRHKSCFQ